jgi:ubiquitin-protein ligase
MLVYPMSLVREEPQVFPNEANMGFWRIVFTAPAATPYAGGVYEMFLSFPATFPEAAPEMRYEVNACLLLLLLHRAFFSIRTGPSRLCGGVLCCVCCCQHSRGCFDVCISNLVVCGGRFVTPILHCNVNCYGKICHSIFGRNWTADTTIASIFENVYGLLLTPDIADPIDTNLAMDFHAGTGKGR